MRPRILSIGHPPHRLGRLRSGRRVPARPSECRVAAPSSAAGPTVSGAWARAAAAGGIERRLLHGDEPDRLRRHAAVGHESGRGHGRDPPDVVDGAGMAAMKPVDQVELPAGDTVEFKPGGYHVMLMRPDRRT